MKTLLRLALLLLFAALPLAAGEEGPLPCCVMEYSYFGVDSDAAFIQPYSVMTAESGFYAGCYNAVTLLSRGGVVRSFLDHAGSGRGKYQLVMDLGSDAENNLYLLENMAKKVVFYDKGGAFAGEINFSASYPLNLAVSPGGVVFIPDTTRNTVTAYDRNGATVRLLSFAPGELVAVNGSHGAVRLLLERDMKYVIENYDEKGMLVKSRTLDFGRAQYFISSFDCDRAGNFYGLDMSKGIVVKAGPDGRVRWLLDRVRGSAREFFNTPYDVSVSADGKDLYVVDMMNKRILRFREFDAPPEAKDAPGFFALARGFETSDPDRYLYCLNSALVNNPGYEPALIAKAAYYEGIGTYTFALEIYQRLLEREPGNARVQGLYQKCQVSQYGKRALDATVKFNRALKDIGPESARVHYDEAVKNYELALKIAPGDAALKAQYEKLKQAYGTPGGERTPQLEIVSTDFQEVFAALYKFYNDNPVGEIVIANRTGADIEKVYAEVQIKDFMDYPTESRVVRDFKDGDSRPLKLYAVFNNRILTVSEDTPLSAQVTVRFVIGGKPYAVTRSASLNLYNRNALTWDNAGKLASFITPKDPVVKVFGRTVVQRFRNARLEFMNKNLQAAIQLFDTLGSYGMAYVSDPKTPFAKHSKLRDQVDYIQYPRETLRYRTGDCDDLTVMFSSLLEHLGIGTALVLVPGHIFMMFDTGVPEAQRDEFTGDAGRVVARGGTLWVPVETTMMGKNFLAAWENAAGQYRKYGKSAGFEVIETKQAWAEFAPVTLEDIAWEPAMPELDTINRLYYADINAIIDAELSRKMGKLQSMLKAEPKNPRVHNSIGVLYASFGRYDEATKSFDRAKELDPNYFSPYNNLGNIALLRGRNEDALVFFNRARDLQPGNAAVHINLALVYKKLNRTADAGSAFSTAVRLDTGLKEQYGFIVAEKEARADAADAAPAAGLWAK